MLNSEREKLVVDLYNQGKNVREISQEARMSFRDIGAILKKAEDASNGNAIDDGKDNNNNNTNNKSANVKATQAYKLFSEGKKLVEVSIELGLRENEASKYFSEFLRLKGQDEVYEIYLENKHYLKSLRKLHRLLKRESVTADRIEWFVNMVKIGTYKIPEIQNKYQSLQNMVQTLQYQKQKLERDSQIVQRRIIELTETEAMYSSNCETLLNEIEHRYNEKCQLEQFVSRFRNTNRRYLKIKSIAEEQLKRLLSEQEPLLDLALNAVIEALRMAHDRYAIIYNTKYDNNVFASNNNNNGTVAAVSYSPSLYQNYYYKEYREGIIEIAKTFFNNMLDQIVDKTMVAAVKAQMKPDLSRANLR